MKYCDENKDTSNFKQTFSEFVDDYQLVVREDKLYKSETPINRQELIESSRDTALANSLEKFLPKEVIDDNETYTEYVTQQSDLDFLMQAENIASDYREKFNLPDTMTTTQVYEFINRQNILLKQQIDDYQKALLNQTNKTVQGASNDETKKD